MSPSRIFLIVALICFGLAAIPWPAMPINLIALGLVFFTLAHMVGGPG
jgi:hypothetical protein